MQLRKPKQSESDLAAEHAAQAARDLALQREETGQPAPGQVEPTTEAVEHAYEAERSAWNAFRERLEQPQDSRRGAEEELQRLNRLVDEKKRNLRHAGSARDRERAERRLEGFERQQSQLHRFLHQPVEADAEVISGPVCRRCGEEFPDKATRFSHVLNCNA